LNILFICSRNKWRSRTAETIFKDHPFHQIRSAGTASSARIRVQENHIKWSDLIFVMEDHHKKRLRDRFGKLLRQKKIVVLHIPDEYEYMDEELIEILESSCRSYLED
jgi:predicted protein tyrosine phosphatase